MTTWEYKVIECSATGVPLGDGDTYGQRMESGFNALGRDGWELCCSIGNSLIFKRQCPRRLSQEAIERARREEPHAYDERVGRGGACWCGWSFSHPIHDISKRQP